MGKYICPVCRAPRHIELRDRLPWSVHLKILSSILFLCGLAFLFRGPLLAFKLSFLYLPAWAVAEFFFWSKQRRITRCPHCGFDPVLYRQDWRQARAITEERLLSIKEQAAIKQRERRAKFLGIKATEQSAAEDASESDAAGKAKAPSALPGGAQENQLSPD